MKRFPKVLLLLLLFVAVIAFVIASVCVCVCVVLMCSLEVSPLLISCVARVVIRRKIISHL